MNGCFEIESIVESAIYRSEADSSFKAALGYLVRKADLNVLIADNSFKEAMITGDSDVSAAIRDAIILGMRIGSLANEIKMGLQRVENYP